MDFRRPIFRKPALDKLASPEQFDELMQITTLRSWVILTAFGSIVLMVLTWGVFGRLSNAVTVQGVLNPLDVSTLQAVAYVPAADVERVRVGMTAQVIPDGEMTSINGSVISVSSSPTRHEDVPLYEVHIRLDRQVNRVYRAGQTGAVRIVVDEISPIQLLIGS